MAVSITIGWWILPVVATISSIIYLLLPDSQPDTFGIGMMLKAIAAVIVILLVWVLYLAIALLFGIR